MFYNTSYKQQHIVREKRGKRMSEDREINTVQDNFSYSNMLENIPTIKNELVSGDEVFTSSVIQRSKQILESM